MQPTTGVASELSAELEARLIREIKARGSIAAGVAESGVNEVVARAAVFAAAQGGRLIRDEVITLPDGTVKHVKQWAPPDAELAFLMLDDLSMERNGRPWGGDTLN
ncbi:hypothetical protein ACFQ08_10000 [Streptosporangium algeriense]|uniref:Uncharacterized protein n=1 Tax=Streptosporangium algeriense TaxID=1682748 RepID=A0ABW3DNZ1_9ACTN